MGNKAKAQTEEFKRIQLLQTYGVIFLGHPPLNLLKKVVYFYPNPDNAEETLVTAQDTKGLCVFLQDGLQVKPSYGKIGFWKRPQLSISNNVCDLRDGILKKLQEQGLAHIPRISDLTIQQY